MSMDKETRSLWEISIEAYKDAAQVTDFMQAEIKGLMDKNGDPLPDAVKKFFSDLLFQKFKPRKGSNFIPSVKAMIRNQYETRLFFEQASRESFPEKVAFGALPPADHVKNVLAEECRTTTATIDQIVSPRKSRNRKKP